MLLYLFIQWYIGSFSKILVLILKNRSEEKLLFLKPNHKTNLTQLFIIGIFIIPSQVEYFTMVQSILSMKFQTIKKSIFIQPARERPSVLIEHKKNKEIMWPTPATRLYEKLVTKSFKRAYDLLPDTGSRQRI